MASISSIGVGSGLDLENLVSQIIASEREPVERRLELRQAEASVREAEASLADARRRLRELFAWAEDEENEEDEEESESNEEPEKPEANP